MSKNALPTNLTQTTSNLTVYRLVCEETVEDNISKKTLQQKLLGDIKLRNTMETGIKETGESITTGRSAGPENGSFWKIKRQTLEDLLFNNQHPQALPIGGDNGIFNSNAQSTDITNKKVHFDFIRLKLYANISML